MFVAFSVESRIEADFHVHDMENVIPTSLGLAARQGRCDELRRLLDAGHHVYNADNRGYTPLHVAAEAGQEECCEFLLQEDGCDPNAQSHEGSTALHLLCLHQDKPSLISLLVRFGADYNLKDCVDSTPLHIAATYNKLEMVRELLKHGARVQVKDFSEYTPLHSAVHKGHVHIARELLSHGANPEDGDELNVTPLYLSAQGGWPECVELLIQHGASVNTSTDDGMTPLMAACQPPCKEEIVRMLLQHGADPDVENDRHLLALSLAVHSGSAPVVKWLLEKTSRDVIIRNSSLAPQEIVSLPCLAIDSDYDGLGCLKLIMDSDLDDTIKNAPISTSYFSALEHSPYKQISPLGLLLALHPQNESMVDVLLNRGCPVNATSPDQMPPLVGLVYSCDCSFEKKWMYFQKLLRKGCNLDYCSLPPETTLNYHLTDALVAILEDTDLENPDATLMLHMVFESSVACNADELLAWLWKKGHHSYKITLNILREYAIKPHFSTDLIQPVLSLQALARVAVRQWLWDTLRDSSKVKSAFHALKIPIIVQDYVIGKAWEDILQ